MLILLVFLVLAPHDAVQSSICSSFLTVSTREFNYHRSNLVINWGPECTDPPFSIKLFDYNPYTVKKPVQIFSVYPNGRKFGRVETSRRLDAFTLPYKWDPSTTLYESLNQSTYQKCLDFYVVSYNATNQAMDFDCLKIEPQWMTKNPEISSLALKDLYIPATHCSGCYQTRENARSKKEDGFHQNFDFWHQLVFGIRFFDFSIGLNRQITSNVFDVGGRFYENIFWIKSDGHLITPLLKILKDVVKFAERSKEIIILNFRAFSSEFIQYPELHKVLQFLIAEEIGSLAYINFGSVNSFDLTIQEMKHAQKYLLIMYNLSNPEGILDGETTIFWPAWQEHTRSNSNEVVLFMQNEFRERIQKDNREGWILSLAASNFKMDLTSHREKAAEINSRALFPLGGAWSLKANVVLLDFAFSTNFVDIAVYVNKIKGAEKGNFTVIDMI